MNRHERVLIFLLRCDAIILLTAVLPAVMPFVWMQEVHRFLGMGELPEGPIMGYLTRSLSVMYAMHGAVTLYVSFDVRRYLLIVKFMAVLGILFGLWLTGIDIAVRMPLFWTISEGPFIFLLSATVRWLASRL
jgi:hypothetical protein